MQTSQRGSVLLTIIGGIVILALLGMVAVSLMTGSVMTGLDAKGNGASLLPRRIGKGNRPGADVKGRYRSKAHDFGG